MPALVLVGAQWGDEGKGKITDYLARSAEAVVRYQGGNNAGHTIVVGGSKYKFHLIPSGMLYADKVCILGNGVVVDAEELLGELDALIASGVDVSRFKVSGAAHYILPTHKFMDQKAEAARGADKIGTTGRGIGPAYRDKVNRCGVRMADAADQAVLAHKVAQHFRDHEDELAGCDWTEAKVVAHLAEAYRRLAPYVASTSTIVNDILDRGGRVLLEGAQGTLLDLDHGTYPFVTSSTPTAGGACVGAGIGPTRIGMVMGVAKAYSTRVGAGPFVTEQPGGVGDELRARGEEYGTTTGRARRCGWLDLMALRYAVRINGMTHLAITKLDVLDAFEELKVCTGYKLAGERLAEFPTEPAILEKVEPVYETFKGWKAPTTGVRSWSELPGKALAYISRLEDFLRLPVALVSVGAERTATFSRLNIWEGR